MYSNNAVLVSLNQRAWKATATDRDIASQAEEANEAETGVISVIKKLTPNHYISPIKSIMAIGRTEHYRMTSPGLTRGLHLLAAPMMQRYTMIQSEVQDQFVLAVNRFVSIYPSILEMAPDRLGKAFKEEDFPTAAQIKTFFEYKIKLVPVPDLNDWRLDGLTNEDTDQIRSDIENDVRSMFNTATRELYDKARSVLEKVANQAKEYKGGPGSSTLRDATIDSLKEMAELIPLMNVTNDPVLFDIGKEMTDNFTNIVGSDLRKNEEMRHDLGATIGRILDRFPKRDG